MPAVQLTLEAQDNASPAVKALDDMLATGALTAKEAAQAYAQVGISADESAARIQAIIGATTAQTSSTRQAIQATQGQDTAAQQASQSESAWDAAIKQLAADLEFERQVAAASAEMTRRLAEATQQAVPATRSLSEYLKQMFGELDPALAAGLKFGAALVGITSALQLAREAFNFTKDAVFAYSDATTQLNVLVPTQLDLQQRYHEILTSLPPVYGDLKTEGEALYRILTSNIRNTTEATALLAAANELAFAGYGKVDNATQLLIRTRATYGAQAGTLEQIEQTYLQTVQTSGTTLDTFAQSFERLLLPAKEAGVTFQDTNLLFSALNDKLKDGSQTTQLLSQFFRALSRDTGQLAAVGIDVKAVMGTEGVEGVLRRVFEVTGGNIEAMRQLLPGMRGMEGVAYLVRDAWKSMHEQQQQTPTIQEAIIARSKGLSEQYGELTNTIQRNVGSMATWVGWVLGGIDALDKAITPTQRHTQAQEATATASRNASRATSEWATTLETIPPRTAATAATVEALQTAAKGLQVDFQKLSGTEFLPKALFEATIRGLITNFDTLATSTDTTFGQLITIGTKTTTEITKQFGFLPDAIKGEMLKLVDNAALELQSLIVQNKLSKDEILAAWGNLSALITKTGFQDLPASVEPLLNRVRQVAAETGKALPVAFEDGYGKIRISSELTAVQIAQNAEKVTKAHEQEAAAAVQAAESNVRASQVLTNAEILATQAALDAAKQTQFTAKEHELAAQKVVLAEEAKRIALDATLTDEKRNAAEAENAAKQRAIAEQQQATATEKANDALVAGRRAKEEAALQTLRLADAAERMRQAEERAASTVAATAEARLRLEEEKVRAARASGQAISDANVRAAQSDLDAARNAQLATERKVLAAQEDVLWKQRIAIEAEKTGSEEVRAARLAINAEEEAVLAAKKLALAQQQLRQTTEEGTRGQQDLGVVTTRTSVMIEDQTTKLDQMTKSVKGMAAEVKEDVGNVLLVFGNWSKVIGQDAATSVQGLTTQINELEHHYSDLIGIVQHLDPGFWIDPFETGKKIIQEEIKLATELSDKLLVLDSQGKEMTDHLQAAYDVLGAKSSNALKQIADAAVQAFLIAQQSGTSTADHLRDIWVNDVVPKIKAAYGTIPPEFQRLNDEMGHAIQQTATQTTQVVQNTAQAVTTADQQASVAAGNLSQAFTTLDTTQQHLLITTVALRNATVALAQAQHGSGLYDAARDGTEALLAQQRAMQTETEMLQSVIPLVHQYTSAIEDAAHAQQTLTSGSLALHPSFYDGGGRGRTASFATGTPYVPTDMLAFLHQGERVVPAAQNAPESEQTMSMTNYFTLNMTLPPAMDRISAQSFVRQLTQALNEAINRGQIKVRELAR